jgi:hypothetical protein
MLNLADDLIAEALAEPRHGETLALRPAWGPTLAVGPARTFLTQALQENWFAFWSAIAALASNDSWVIWAADNPTEQTGLL